MKKYLAIFLILLLSLTACQTSKTTEKEVVESKIKVGFVYNGAADDYGWTYAHEVGRKYLEEQMVDVETQYEVALETDAEAVKAAMVKLIEEGNEVIVSTSAGYLPVVTELKVEYPEITFIHTQATSAEGVTTIMPRFYQAKYLAGYGAGLMTENDVLGYISSYKFPGSIMWVNGFAQGVKDANPDAVVYLKWAQTWDDPETEQNIALELISEYDADVLAQEQNSPTIPQVAETNGRYALGDYANMMSFAPNAIITTPALNWGPFYVQMLGEYKAGTLKSELYWLSMTDSEGEVKASDITEFGSFVPEDVKSAVLEKRTQMIDGSFNPFPNVNTVQDLDGIELLDNIVELE